MALSSRVSGSSHGWLLLAVVLMAICNLQLLSDTWYPIHDNLARYTYFHTFFQEWLFHRELPHWFPYVNYGVATYFSQWNAISPMGYLVGATGAWLQSDQPLLLFKIQLFVEAEFFAVGLALLSMRFFATWSARLLVVVSGILSLIWWFQPNFNFYTYYVLPWILYGLARFFASRHPFWLGVTAVMVLFSRIGVFVYFAPVLAWTLILLSLPLWWHCPRALVVFKDGRLLAFLLALILLAAGLGGSLADSLGHFTLMKVGRDAGSGVNTLDSFLIYARFDPPEILGTLLTASTPSGPILDFPLFIGWLPWLLFGYGLLTVRNPWFTGLALVIALWTWTSLGELFATAVYELLPGMNLYRHISYLLLFVKILVILAAGFGMEDLHQRLTRPASARPPAPFLGPLAPYALLILLLMGLDIGLNPLFWDEPLLEDWTFTASQQTFLQLRLALYGLAALALLVHRGRAPGKSVLLLLLIVGLGDLASYRLLKSREEVGFQFFLPMDPHWRRAIPTPFVLTRADLPRDRARQREQWLKHARHTKGMVYSEFYQMAEEDPCFPLFHYEFLQTPVHQMIVARGGHPGNYLGYIRQAMVVSHQPMLPPADTAFHASMGCLAPKLKLFGRWQTAPDDQLTRQFALLARPDETILLAGEVIGHHENPVADDPGSIQVLGHTTNTLRLTVTVHGDQPVWLYYADAYHPAWQARVDDQPVPVVRANVGFKAVAVPPGQHQVLWRFGPNGQTRWSLLVACLGWLAGLLATGAMGMVLVIGWRHTDHDHSPTRPC